MTTQYIFLPSHLLLVALFVALCISLQSLVFVLLHSQISVNQPIHELFGMLHAQHLLVTQKGRLVGKTWELVFKADRTSSLITPACSSLESAIQSGSFCAHRFWKHSLFSGTASPKSWWTLEKYWCSESSGSAFETRLILTQSAGNKYTAQEITEKFSHENKKVILFWTWIKKKEVVLYKCCAKKDIISHRGMSEQGGTSQQVQGEQTENLKLRAKSKLKSSRVRKKKTSSSP